MTFRPIRVRRIRVEAYFSRSQHGREDDLALCIQTVDRAF